MKDLHNIEKSMHAGEYVGYADGAWRITRSGMVWCVSHQNGGYPPFTLSTLVGISARLDTIADRARAKQKASAHIQGTQP